jgi:hypothetical protein
MDKILLFICSIEKISVEKQTNKQIFNVETKTKSHNTNCQAYMFCLCVYMRLFEIVFFFLFFFFFFCKASRQHAIILYSLAFVRHRDRLDLDRLCLLSMELLKRNVGQSSSIHRVVLRLDSNENLADFRRFLAKNRTALHVISYGHLMLSMLFV